MNIKYFLFFLFFTFLTTSCEEKYIYNQGFIYGTTYNIIYSSTIDHHTQIDSVLQVLDHSLSTFNPYSTISKINRNTPTTLDSIFINCFKTAKKIYDKTNGAFDITVAPLVNLWGFGFENKESLDTNCIDSLLTLVGMNKIMIKNKQIIKTCSNITLDASAIAKGYAVDLVADYLNSQGTKNYLIEIGGEIRTQGFNPDKKRWKIGIDKPIPDTKARARELQTIVQSNNQAIATSGNYRNFYIKENKMYSHTIDPKTGYPVQHNLLSATVFAPNCMIADAYATACMVLGVEKSIKLAETTPKIDIHLIYQDSTTLQTYTSENIKKNLIGEKK